MRAPSGETSCNPSACSARSRKIVGGRATSSTRPRAPDRIYSKWGAFLDEIAFDPTAYGIPPASLPSIEPVQLLALHVATRALADAGFDRRPFPKDRTATIFASGAMNELGTLYVFRTLLSHYLAKVAGLSEETRAQIVSSLYGGELPQWTPDSFPGFLANVAAGRVSNRLDLRGEFHRRRGLLLLARRARRRHSRAAVA